MNSNDELNKRYDACLNLISNPEKEQLEDEYKDYLSHRFKYRRSLTDPDARFINIDGIGIFPYDSLTMLKSTVSQTSSYISYFLEIILEKISGYYKTIYPEFFLIRFEKNKQYTLVIPKNNIDDCKNLKFQVY